MWKKTFIIFIFCSLFFIPVFCGAEEKKEFKDPLQDIAGAAKYSTNVTETSLSQTVGGIIKTVLGLLGVIFFALTFYAGFLWLTANGNDEKVERAKKIITAATIGLAIVIMSYSIASLVTKSTKSITTPTSTVG